jgi:acyl carrier protein
MDVAGRVMDFVKEDLLLDGSTTTLAVDTPLLDGVMDSLGLMQLVAFLEEEFAIQIDDVDVTVAHFRTVADIDRFVNEKARQA